MQQAAVGEGLSFDPLPFEQDRLPASKVDVGGGEVVEALVSARVIVVRHTGPHLRLQIARQVVVLQQDAVLERLMPALDLVPPAVGETLIEGYAARAAGGSWFCRTAAGVRNPCGSMSQLVL